MILLAEGERECDVQLLHPSSHFFRRICLLEFNFDEQRLHHCVNLIQDG